MADTPKPQTINAPALVVPVPWRAYAQLVRLPNVFTAFADIVLGGLAVRGLAAPADWWSALPWLLAASACLYSAGMVWNDYFDWEQDRRERPFRPLPSGRVSRKAARHFGIALFVAGLVSAAFAGWQGGEWRAISFGLAAALVVAILLYDRWLKRSWAGPLGMGACRFLNVLLGFSVVAGAVGQGIFPASVVGLYIVGVTWFARTEARLSSRPALVAAGAVMLAALLFALALPVSVPRGTCSPLFPYLLVALGFFVGIPVCRALARPVPSCVQSAVKRAIFGLVILDAVMASALAGNVGLIILGLLLPAAYLGRWIYST